MRRSFWALPTTLVEWIVIVFVVLALACVFLPDFPAYFDDPGPLGPKHRALPSGRQQRDDTQRPSTPSGDFHR